MRQGTKQFWIVSIPSKHNGLNSFNNTSSSDPTAISVKFKLDLYLLLQSFVYMIPQSIRVA